MTTWYKFEDKKPPKGIEVIAYNSKWIDEDFNPTGQRVGFLSDLGFTSAYWWDYQGDYVAICSGDDNDAFDPNGNTAKYTEPEFWAEMPKFLDAKDGQ